MPSCSNSSNLTSAINSLNVSQGSAGSRFVVQIDYSSAPGITVGNVIRYDVAATGYTASKANTPESAEVFGVVESYSSTTNSFNVVMGGSINLPVGYLSYMSTDPTGAGGGNDIFFLSGLTAGKLQNLAPDDITHIIKPIYQVAPHGSYTGIITNYSGYRLGGDAQAGIDTVNMISKVGSSQIVFESVAYEYPEETKLRTFGFDFANPAAVAPLFQLPETTVYDWKLEYINTSNQYPTLIRYIDFKDFCDNVMPIMNGGWVERVKVDSSYSINRIDVIGKLVRQLNHGNYDSTNITTSWYGEILDYDATTRYLFIRRPALLDDNLMSNIANYLAETTIGSRSTGILQIMSTTLQSGQVGTIQQQITIRDTVRSHQLFGFIIPTVRLSSYGQGNDPFYFQTIYDPYNSTVFETTGVNPKVYMKIKNRGISLVVPDNISVSEVTTDTITLPAYDLVTKIADLQNQIDCLKFPGTC